MEANLVNRQELKVAFDAFNAQSGILEQSYRDLEMKVSALTRKLNTEQSARLIDLRKTAALSKRLNHLLESLPGGIVVLDAAGEVIQHNSEAVALLGRPLLGMSWASIVKREVQADAGEDGNLKLRDGRWLNLARRRLVEEDGEVLLVADVTESRKVTELRQRQERLTSIGEMTAEFAHQVRTPLASAMLYAAQIHTPDAAQQRIVSKISERLSDLGRMVDDMLQFAAGPKAASERVNVHSLVSSAVQVVEEQLRADTRLHFLVRDENLYLLGNADALRGALINLIKNADQSGQDATNIVVSGRIVEDSICLAVSDNGNGIPDDLVSEIFEPFFTTRPQGTGLGLSVVRAVAAAHGGEATAVSSPLGTTITLSLPFDQEIQNA